MTDTTLPFPYQSDQQYADWAESQSQQQADWQESQACETHTFEQLKSAIEGQTPCRLVKTRDEDGYRTYTLLDGCGDAMGDAFPDLKEVYFYVSNNDQVLEELKSCVS